MASLGDGLVVAQDMTTMACGAFNAAHFLSYLRPSLQRQQRPARRVAAFTLVVISAGAAIESLYLLSLYLLHHGGRSAAVAALVSPGPWLLARLLAFTGMVLLTALILRQQWRNGDGGR